MIAQATVYDYLKEYFQFVFQWDEDENGIRWCEKTDDPSFDDYLEEVFKFSATNNWESGFDFVDWLLGQNDMGNHYNATAKIQSLDNLLTFKETCCITNRIVKHYESVYGDASCFLDEITCESVLRHLAYVELAELSLEDLRELLNTNN